MSTINNTPNLPSPNSANVTPPAEQATSYTATASSLSGGEGFVIRDRNGQPVIVDLATVGMMLAFSRTENIEKQIAIQGDVVKDINKKIEKITNVMNLCRKTRADERGAGTTVTFEGQKRTLADILMNDLGVEVLCTGNLVRPGSGFWNWVKGIFGKDEKGNADSWNQQWEGTIGGVKAKIDDLTADVQEANSKFENLNQKRGNAFKAVSKIMDTENQTMQKVLSRM